MQQRPSFEVLLSLRNITPGGRAGQGVLAKKLSQKALQHCKLKTVLRLFCVCVFVTDPNGKVFFFLLWVACCSPLYIRITYIVKRQLTNAPDDSAVFSCFWQDKFTCQFSQFTQIYLPLPSRFIAIMLLLLLLLLLLPLSLFLESCNVMPN